MVTIDEAIKKGHRMVTYPGMTIMFGLMGVCYYLDKQKVVSTTTLVLGVIFSFIISWLYWSFMITKWKLWSFENVKDLDELKARAIQERLIWKDGSIFEKTEIRSKIEKEKLRKLQNKKSTNEGSVNSP